MERVALISGGARGIGKAIAKELYFADYKICILYNNSQEQANALVKEFNQGGKLNCIALQCDVRDYDACSKAVEKCLAVFGCITHLVNNAGIAHIAPLIDTDIVAWRNVINTNLNSVYYLTHAALPNMLSNGYGNIINISSVWGVYGASCEVAYSTAKAGMIGFTKALAQEMGLSNIRVNAVAAGVINTDMNKTLTADDLNALKQSTSLGRIGEPEEIAKTVKFLASQDSGFITGQTIEVTGGFKG